MAKTIKFSNPKALTLHVVRVSKATKKLRRAGLYLPDSELVAEPSRDPAP